MVSLIFIEICVERFRKIRLQSARTIQQLQILDVKVNLLIHTLNLISFNILDWIGGLRRHALNQSIAKDGATLLSPALAHIVPYYRY